MKSNFRSLAIYSNELSLLKPFSKALLAKTHKHQKQLDQKVNLITYNNIHPKTVGIKLMHQTLCICMVVYI